jgi:hypothetical protein
MGTRGASQGATGYVMLKMLAGRSFAARRCGAALAVLVLLSGVLSVAEPQCEAVVCCFVPCCV